METCIKFNKSTGSNNHTGWKNAKNWEKVHGFHKSAESAMVTDHTKMLSPQGICSYNALDFDCVLL